MRPGLVKVTHLRLYASPLLKAALNTKQAVNPISSFDCIPSQITTMIVGRDWFPVNLLLNGPHLWPLLQASSPCQPHAQAQPASPFRFEHPKWVYRGATGRRSTALQVNHPVSHTFAVTSRVQAQPPLPPAARAPQVDLHIYARVLPPSPDFNPKTQAALPPSSMLPTPDRLPLRQKRTLTIASPVGYSRRRPQLEHWPCPPSSTPPRSARAGGWRMLTAKIKKNAGPVAVPDKRDRRLLRK
ncbi:hypothetical protein C8J57DRAFT_1716807 [Mycena rebaudengoi]|nr:hypothetical protein C8J57DRAFT_1716807 [Mycena rebaudengoi]